MTGNFYFHIKLAFLSIGTLLVILLPDVMLWKMVRLEHEESPPVLMALQSLEFLMTLVASLSVSTPMFFELLFRVISKAKLDYVLPNVLSLTALALPDLIILCYVRSSSDLTILNIVLQCRPLLFAWLVFTIIKMYGGHQWSHAGLLFIFTFFCIGRILSIYKEYADNGLYNLINILGIISDFITMSIYIYMCLKWFHFIYQHTKRAPITTNQYICNIYVTANLLTCLGLFINLYASSSTDWFNWTTNELSIHTLMYTIFYIIVIVFEGRVLQREMLQAKVSRVIYFL